MPRGLSGACICVELQAGIHCRAGAVRRKRRAEPGGAGPRPQQPARPLPVIEPPTASAPLSVEEVLRERQDDVPAAQTDDKPETEGETSEQPPISDEPDTPAEDESKKESSENE